MSLQVRILVLVAMTLAAVGVVVVGVTTRTLGHFAEERTEQAVDVVLDRVGQQFGQYSSNLAANVDLFANSETLRNYLDADNEMLRLSVLQPPLLELFATYQASYPNYFEIRVLDLDGFEETRLVTGSRGNVTEDEAGTPFFELLSGASGQAVVAVLPDVDADGLAMFAGRAVTIENFDIDPVTPEQEVRGYLAVSAGLQYLQDLVNDVRIGRGGILIISAADGQFAFAPSDLEFATSGALLAFDSARSTVEIGGEQYQVTQRPMGPDLAANVLIPISELDAERSRLSAWLVALIGILTLAAGGLIVMVLRRTVVSPITALQSVAHAVRAGRLDVQVPGGLGGEIGDLANALKEMTLGLREQRIELTEKQRALETIAYYDNLTGLPNRSLFRARLDQAIALAHRYRYALALMFVDLDGFKRVNDTLGHDAGDELLKVVAIRMKSALRDSDVVSLAGEPPGRAGDNGNAVTTTPDGRDIARLGGDEFTITLSRIDARDDAALIAQRVLKALSKPVILMGQEVVTTPSIGIALFPGDGDEPDALLRRADAAMYAAKRSGKNRVSFYSMEMERRVGARMLMEQRLREAVASNRLQLHYQPMVSALDGRPVAVEALTRWHDEQLGHVRPDVFIALAEEVGLIHELGAWCLHAACRQLASWSQEFPDLVICVNVSGAQVLDDNFQAELSDVLARTGASAAHLELELTERSVMSESVRTRQRLDGIREMGVRIAVDDFGTDYSSLAYLKRLPLDVLKIDKRFVTNIDSDKENRAITAAIVALARALDLATVAEGVETPGERATLTELGADLLQGWLFSKALAPEECAQWIRANPRSPLAAEPPARVPVEQR